MTVKSAGDAPALEYRRDTTVLVLPNHGVSACIVRTAIILPKNARMAIVATPKVAIRHGSRTVAFCRNGDTVSDLIGPALSSVGILNNNHVVGRAANGDRTFGKLVGDFALCFAGQN